MLKSIGKKKKEVMDSLMEKFIEGLKKINWSKDQIERLWKLIEAQSTYSFNRSHGCSYALLSYVTAYLKHYYPRIYDFFTN